MIQLLSEHLSELLFFFDELFRVLNFEITELVYIFYQLFELCLEKLINLGIDGFSKLIPSLDKFFRQGRPNLHFQLGTLLGKKCVYRSFELRRDFRFGLFAEKIGFKQLL